MLAPVRFLQKALFAQNFCMHTVDFSLVYTQKQPVSLLSFARLQLRSCHRLFLSPKMSMSLLRPFQFNYDMYTGKVLLISKECDQCF